MPDFPPQEKKKILADPVSLFGTHHPQASSEQRLTLASLAQQYAGLKKQHRDVQKRTRRLSGLIGDARRNGKSTDELLVAMQQHSKQLKSLADQLTTTGTRILDHFRSVADEDSTDNALASRWQPDSGNISACPDVRISLEDPVREDWNRYVDANTAASIYHRAEWRQLIGETFGHRGYYFAARSGDGEIAGILPLIRLKSRLFGDFMVSMPYFNYGGAVAGHPLIETKLMHAAAEHAASLGISHIEYRDDTPRDGFPVRTDKVNMVLTLPDSHEALWQSFTPKLRAQIRRPQREKVRVLQDGKAALDDFYSVFTRNMRDLGTPVYPKAFFRHILNCFPEACRILVVRLNDRPAAACILVGHRDRLEIPWASSIRDVNHLSINMLLYWEALKFAIDKHYRHFDFGRSSRDSGTYRFKQQWGARPSQLYWHYWLKPGTALPALSPDNPRYALAINIWRRLPLSVTNRLGPLIVRNLP